MSDFDELRDYGPEDFLASSTTPLRRYTVDEATRALLDRIGQEDHSITSEYAIFGVPGSGKTTAIEYLARREWERRGPKALLLASYTRAAAKELAGRHLPLAPDCVGTLHAHCYRVIGRPKIIEETKEMIERWNLENPKYPYQRRKGGRDLMDDEDEPRSEDPDEPWHEKLTFYRATLRPWELWNGEEKKLFRRWQEFKARHSLVDYTDMIEQAIARFPYHPDSPQVLMVDEIQDCTPLQLKLIWQWGRGAEWVVVAGDDDQSIFGWLGADPWGVAARKLPKNHIIILPHTHRMAVRIDRSGLVWIDQVQDRQEKPHTARNAEGSVREISGKWHTKEPLFSVLPPLENELAAGRRVMVLAACEYMLRDLAGILRQHLIAFHNPYQPHKPGWNPLAVRAGGVRDLIEALTDAVRDNRAWRAGEVATWIKPLMTGGVLVRGARTAIGELDPERVVTTLDLDSWFLPDVAEELVASFATDARALVQWWGRQLRAEQAARYYLAVGIASARGPVALSETPRVILGTIHSVKGGESDTVILFPDISPKAQRRSHPDEIVRQFYVGMTRARERLLLAQASSKCSTWWYPALDGYVDGRD